LTLMMRSKFPFNPSRCYLVFVSEFQTLLIIDLPYSKVGRETPAKKARSAPEAHIEDGPVGSPRPSRTLGSEAREEGAGKDPSGSTASPGNV
jgi:hypothetical protein